VNSLTSQLRPYLLDLPGTDETKLKVAVPLARDLLGIPRQ
jgi:hypothetical protein